MEQKTLCKKCGAEIGTGDAFCSNCGAPQDVGHSEQIAVCTNCGAEVKPGSTFCPNCGNRLAGEQSGSTQQTRASFKTDESETKSQNTFFANDPLGSVAKYMKKVNLLCIVGLVIFLYGTLFFKHSLVMLAAFFFFAYRLFRCKKETSDR